MQPWILITGASRGIGRSISLELASSGYNTVLTSRSPETLEGVKSEILERFPETECRVFRMDVRDLKEIKSTFDDLARQGIILSGLVNNAGIMKDATLITARSSDLEDIFQTNFYGTFFCSQAAIKHFLRLRTGAIVNVASIVGVYGNNGQTMYASSKSAVIGFTKSLAKELASLNIRVNAVAPGFIETDMIKGVEEKFYERNFKNIGMRVLGKPEDVAKTVAFLMSDNASYITGQIIGIDGSMIV